MGRIAICTSLLKMTQGDSQGLTTVTFDTVKHLFEPRCTVPHELLLQSWFSLPNKRTAR